MTNLGREAGPPSVRTRRPITERDAPDPSMIEDWDDEEEEDPRPDLDPDYERKSNVRSIG